MIEIVAKIAVNSRISTSEPGKKYSRYESRAAPSPARRNDGPKPGAEQQPKNDRLADRAEHAIALPHEAHPLALAQAWPTASHGRGAIGAAAVRCVAESSAASCAMRSPRLRRGQCVCAGRLPKAMAGAGDEHVFQRRLAQRDRLDLAGKRLDQPRDPLVAVGLFQPHAAVEHPRRRNRIARAMAAARRAGSAVWIVIESPPTVARSASGVSSATSWPSCKMAMRSALSASSSRCVVSTTVTPLLVAQRAQIVPQVAAGAGIEPRAGLVEQQQARTVQHALGQLDAAPQSAGERLDPIAGPIGQPEPGEHFARRDCAASRPDRPYRCPWWRRFSATVSFLSRLGA